ncbi:MAG: PD-(D/E)XK nuclease family protein [Alphaproteobacteria bacterium]
MRKTLVVHSRHAWRSHRTWAALDAAQGLQLVTIEQMASRLAGGFLQAIDQEDFKTAIANTLSAALGEIEAIKSLPGFQRAAAVSLSKAWSAGIMLTDEAKTASEPTARLRLEALALLETEVMARLPRNQRRPGDLVAEALHRVKFSKAVFGSIEIHGRTEMSPVWRPLIASMAAETEIVWVAESRHIPDWLAASGVKIETSIAATPLTRAISCASPRHEILEALRWVRQHLAHGAKPEQIAIATASPENWDDHVLALSEAGNLPIHFVHGRAALSTSEGQIAAALAEILLRGLSRSRVMRLLALLRSRVARFQSLPGDWWHALPDDAPLLNAARWRRAIDAVAPEGFSDGVDHRPLLAETIDIIGNGLSAAVETGEQLLDARTLAIWRKALTEGPPAALDVTLTGLRVDDGVEPEAAIVWAPASAIAAVPRPFTWLVGLTSRSWPRSAGEDPLLPDHIIEPARIDPLPVHQADRRDFHSICDLTVNELVCSRARRDSGGRLNGVSPLFPRTVQEVYVAQSREPEHAASASDRLMARPDEFALLPTARAALTAWIDWHTDAITAHDGLVRHDHPLLLRALNRRQSASSLVKLLRDPIGYLWTYGFGWKEPEETDEPLKLDPLAFGNLLHEVLQETVTRLETSRPDGFVGAAPVEISTAIEAAKTTIAARWAETLPIPPPIIWQRKCAEVAELAETALSHRDGPLVGQRSWAEISFGGDRRAEALDAEARAGLPWDPLTSVQIPGTEIQIGGSIDRLDLAGDRRAARVTDYKSGRLRGRPPQLKGGAELQRCLYAYAVKALVAEGPEVEAQLLYPRRGGQGLPLENPEGTLTKLTAFLIAASDSFRAGNALPGPSAEEEWYDLSFALPGGAKESYLAKMKPLVAERLSAIAPLWDEA